MSKWLHLNNSHAYPFCKTTPGTISESRQQYCAIELRHQFFRCSNWDRIFVSETRSKWLQNYSVSESEGAPLQQMVCVFWKRKRKFSNAAASSVSNLQNTLWVHFILIFNIERVCTDLFALLMQIGLLWWFNGHRDHLLLR